MNVGVLKFHYAMVYKHSIFAVDCQDEIEDIFRESARRHLPGEPISMGVKWSMTGNRPRLLIDGSIGPGDVQFIESNCMFFFARSLVHMQRLGFEVVDFTKRMVALEDRRADRASYISQFAKRQKYI